MRKLENSELDRKSIDAFKNADCKLYTLSDYPSLIQYALANNIIPKETESLLGEWRKNPGAWMQ